MPMFRENTQPAGAKGPKHDFVMQSFNSATVCDICKKLLRYEHVNTSVAIGTIDIVVTSACSRQT